MPLRFLFAIILCWGLSSAAWAEEALDYDGTQFPYRAYVSSDDVYVRSGPGQNYYPVLRLRRGAEVEVYRHDPGGWYAIRPTAECFSWVSAEFVEPGDGTLATIKGDRVVARVGSAFSDIRDVIQVRLDEGEPIEVLEAKRIGTGPAAQTWYKILPPPGEFRWVSGQFIDRELRPREARQRDPNNNLLIARHTRTHDEPREEVDPVPPRHETARHEPAPRAPAAARQDDNAREDDARDSGWRPPPSEISRRRETHAAANPELLQELDNVDLELSAEVAKDPSTWNLRPIRWRTDALLSRSQTALDRGRVRLVQRKVARFEDIKQRYDTIAVAHLSTDQRNQEVARASLGGSLGTAADGGRFDGVGRLTQVYPAQAGVAGFALVDAQGSVTHYVTAAPGVNLRSYLGQNVGVQGTLGYMPDARTQHVMAKRVAPVDPTTMLR